LRSKEETGAVPERRGQGLSMPRGTGSLRPFFEDLVVPPDGEEARAGLLVLDLPDLSPEIIVGFP